MHKLITKIKIDNSRKEGVVLGQYSLYIASLMIVNSSNEILFLFNKKLLTILFELLTCYPGGSSSKYISSNVTQIS